MALASKIASLFFFKVNKSLILISYVVSVNDFVFKKMHFYDERIRKFNITTSHLDQNTKIFQSIPIVCGALYSQLIKISVATSMKCILILQF